MAKKIGNYLIPFRDGNQESYPAWSGSEMLPNFSFEDTLVYQGYGRGRSAVYVNFVRESNGKSVTMFISDFIDISVAGRMCDGGKVTGVFTFVKKGANYGCALLEVE